jgi:(p)ppGpp synthase/HD superfamily hydrolase
MTALTLPPGDDPMRRFSQDSYMRAWRFAAEKHRGQTMTGSDLPYVTHVGAVAMEVIAALMVEAVAEPDLAVVVALLHDTIEDTGATQDEIAAAFGDAVARGVAALSKDPRLPKEERLADSLRRIKLAPPEIALVKLADRVVNLEPAPPDWSRDKRRTYRAEARTILAELGAASPSLAARLADKIARYDGGDAP